MSRFLSALLLFAVAASTQAQALDIIWSVVTGDAGLCIVRDLYPVEDGIVVAVTNGEESDTMSSDLWVDKYDFNGNLLWRTVIDHEYSTARLVGYGVDELQNGDLAVICPAVVGPANAHPFLTILQPDGTLIDTFLVDLGFPAWGLDVEQAADGDLIICGWGYHWAISEPGQDAFMAKVSVTGEMRWHRWLGAPGQQDQAWSVEVLSDGNFACAGRTWWTGGAGNRDAVIWKLTPDGEEIWTTTYGGPDKDHIYEFQETPDGGFIGTGKTESFDQGEWDNGDAWLLRFDSEGNFLWRVLWGWEQLEFGRSIDLTYDGGYVMAGVTMPPDESMGNQLLVAKARSDGAWEWSFYTGGPSMEDLWAIREIAPGDYVVGGLTKSFGDIPRSAMILRLREPWAAVGDPKPREVDTPSESGVSLAAGPNPFNGPGVVRVELATPGAVSLSLHDILGRRVMMLHDGQLTVGQHQFMLDPSALSSGSYFLRLQRENELNDVQRLTIIH